jgi:ABC-type lipoprotein release transport system permease subunit
MRPGTLAIARRNLWRNRRRTLITLSSIAFGSMLAVILTGIGDSNWSRMIDLAARLGSGHVTVQHAEYLDAPTVARTIDGAARIRATAEADPDVVAVVERIHGAMMLSAAGRSYGASFIAYAPEAESGETLSVLDAVSVGRAPATSEGRGLVLGADLARNLGVEVGRKVVFSLTDADGEVVQEAARIVGLVRTGAPSVDAGLVLVPLGRMREVLGYAPGETLQLAVFLRDQRLSGEVARRLGASLAGDVAALSWDAAQPELAAFIAMKVAGARFMEILILVLIAAGIFNTLFVSVMERMREFGILLAVGASPARIFALVMGESLWLGLYGLVAAAVLTAGPYWLLATRGIDVSGMLGEGSAEIAGVALAPMLYAAIRGENLLAIAGAALGATLLAGLYPAWRAGRVEPVDAIRLV